MLKKGILRNDNALLWAIFISFECRSILKTLESRILSTKKGLVSRHRVLNELGFWGVAKFPSTDDKYTTFEAFADEVPRHERTQERFAQWEAINENQ